jgi:hypothetical protein
MCQSISRNGRSVVAKRLRNRNTYLEGVEWKQLVVLNGLTSNGVEPSTVGSRLPLMRAWRPERSRMMVRAPQAATISRLSHAIQL